MKLSHSSVSMYSLCGKKYYYHYVERYRDRNVSSALLFGSALDSALNHLLEDLKVNNLDWLAQSYIWTFTSKWRKGFINKEEQDLVTNEKLVYADSDFDKELISDKDIDAVHTLFDGTYKPLGVAIESEDVLKIFDAIKEKKKEKGYDKLSLLERKFYNHLNWISLHAKGILMLKAYFKHVVPNIKEVITSQQMIELSDGNSTKIVGFIDAILKWKDDSIVVFDHKTSARDYSPDSVKSSQQLALYLDSVKDTLKTDKAGYIVLKKQISKNRKKKCLVCGNESVGRAKTCDAELDGKRCGGEWKEKIAPEADVQVIIDTIDQSFRDVVLDNFMEVRDAINHKVFPRNLSACDQPFPCPFKKLCLQNVTNDVIKVEHE